MSSSGELDKTADAGTAQTASLALAPGSHLGKYRLDRVLGEGGMGVVWAAHDPDLERSVAIKVLRYAQASQQLRQRLLREARAMAKLKHPNVLTVYEVGTVGDRDYIAMELVDGMTLDAWLALGPTPDEIWSAVLAAGRGLAAAHEAGVVHRDFKPHNVLRSRGGRILVTDFGLARGMLAEDETAAIASELPDAAITPFEETMEAKPSRKSSSLGGAGRRSDPVLDSPLTQTGALIGTPAYMAPEQYRGAPPDPRTDQFAFCVTAWQALTGERPFKGASLDEMRRSASAGVAHVEAKLPRGVRAVLSRGLDPDANQRWPAMDDLLDALERAAKAPGRRRLLWSYAIATLLVGAALIWKFGFSDDARAKAACDDPDSQFGEAWSPALKAELARKTSAANAQRIGDQLDRYAERWIESYAKACRTRKEKSSRQRIACLEGIRDRVSAITGVLGEAPPHVLDIFEPRDANPPVASCETASPLAPPRVPTEQPRRHQILKMLGKGLALRGTPPDKLGAAMDALLAEAKPLAWPPLDSIVLVAGANEYLRAQQPALARETFNRAIASLPKQAALRDVRIEGTAYLGLLETSLRELENPRAALPPGIADPRAQVPLHGELAVRITKATNAANGDPMLLASRSLLAAIAYAHAAQWNRYESGYEEALRLIADARKQFEEIGDVQRAAAATSIEAWVYLLRGDDRALDDALFAARRAQDALASAKLPRNPSLDQVRATVAFARREYKELYRILSADGPMEPRRASSQLIKGRVVGEKAEQAVVVVWQGDLVGHAANIAMNPRAMTGNIVKVEPDGSFEIQAGPDWAIMAESKNVRSTPRRIGMTALTLQLEPTVTISGQLEGGSSFGIKAFARYDVGDNRWTLQTPIDKDGAFDLRGLPPGARSYGTTGAAGTGERTIMAGADPKAMRWSFGSGIDVIVRAKEFGDGAQAWVLRGDHAVKTRDELDALAKKLTDVSTSRLGPVGADNTDAGRDIYRAGDRHAVVTGNYELQLYTVCATASAAGPFACKRLSVEKSVSIDYQDGRHGAGVTPILFEL